MKHFNITTTMQAVLLSDNATPDTVRSHTEQRVHDMVHAAGKSSPNMAIRLLTFHVTDASAAAAPGQGGDANRIARDAEHRRPSPAGILREALERLMREVQQHTTAVSLRDALSLAQLALDAAKATDAAAGGKEG